MKYVAFLRGINVGGHKIIRMSELAAMFESLGYSRVKTHIASGNVLFADGDHSALPTNGLSARRDQIQRAILNTFGHEVVVMVRSCEEIAEVAARLPLPAPPHSRAKTQDSRDPTDDRVYVIFLAEPPLQEAVANLRTLESEIDRFEVRLTEVIWMCNRSIGPSLLNSVAIEKKLGVAATTRDANTIRKLASLCSMRTST